MRGAGCVALTTYKTFIISDALRQHLDFTAKQLVGRGTGVIIVN